MLVSIAKTVTMPRERIVSGEAQGEEESHFNYALRPQRFAQYVGQATLICHFLTDSTARCTGTLRTTFSEPATKVLSAARVNLLSWSTFSPVLGE